MKLRHNTREVYQPSSANKIIIAWLVAFVLVLFANFLVWVFLDKLDRDPHLYNARTRWKLLFEKKRDWLIFGDSACQHGLVTSLFNDSLHADAVNLGTFAAMTLINDAWMLNAYIEKFGPPKHVVMVHTFDVTTRWPVTPAVMAWVPQPAGFWKKFTPDLHVSTADAITVQLEKYAPLYYRFELLRRMLRNPLKSFFRVPETPTADGFMPIDQPDSAFTISDAQFYLNLYRGQTYEPAPGTVVALNRLRELADTYHFPVYFVNAPLYEGLLSDSTFMHHFNAYRDHIRRWSESSPYLHYLLFDPPAFPANEMQCANHTTTQSARDYTLSVIRALRAEPSREPQ